MWCWPKLCYSKESALHKQFTNPQISVVQMMADKVASSITFIAIVAEKLYILCKGLLATQKQEHSMALKTPQSWSRPVYRTNKQAKQLQESFLIHIAALTAVPRGKPFHSSRWPMGFWLPVMTVWLEVSVWGRAYALWKSVKQRLKSPPSGNTRDKLMASLPSCYSPHLIHISEGQNSPRVNICRMFRKQ